MKLLNTLNGLEYLFINGRLMVNNGGKWKLSSLDEGTHAETLSKIQDWINDRIMTLL